MPNEPIETETDRRLFEIFKMAVQDERKAQHLYALALNLCTDPSLRAVFEVLISDERRHEQILIERYNALARRGAATEDRPPEAAAGLRG